MKRLFLLVLCVVIASVMAVTAVAAGSADFSLTSSTTKLYRGDTVTLTAAVASGEAATQYGLMLEYDESVFELVEGSCTVDAFIKSFDNGFAFMFQDAKAYSGNVGTVTLKVKDNAAFGNVTVKGNASVKNGSDDVVANGCSVTLTIECKHSYGNWVNADNVHKQTCNICQDVKTADHTWDDGVKSKEATCGAEGELKYTCTACNAVKTEVINKLDHNFGDWTKADETNHKRVCKDCSFEETAAHAFGEELTAGETTHWNACACGEKKNETEHKFDETKWSADGDNHWHACSCGAKKDSAAHSWDDGKVTVEPTTQKEGEKKFTCKECGAEKTEKIPAVKPTPAPGGNPQTGSTTMIIAIMLAVVSLCGVTVCSVVGKKSAR